MKDERRGAGDQMEDNFEVIQDNVPMGLCLKIIDWCICLYRVINVQQAVRDKDWNLMTNFLWPLDLSLDLTAFYG